MTLFDGGKLKPGIYKIQNIVGETYLDIREHNKELCCRPDFVLGGKGQWEILPLGSGYTIRRLEPGRPDQFCNVLSGSMDHDGRVAISVSTFPAAWRVEEVHDKHYMGYEYVRFFWGTSNLTWDLADYGSSNDRTPVHYKDNGIEGSQPCRVWKLTPVKLHAGFQPPILKADSPPEYRDKHE
ncbi:hypothetical protein BJ322DRAFT_1111690 [Thelephora terrestris]|uniref:Uncharacterized protein n=1 Tax=Thelephora terrestris TaxID=56493 RepID=A0A9P6HAN5_9AGAM|nr:hypothetical protein BJ322DRAFT_1111690 [Thelephora terrestris]